MAGHLKVAPNVAGVRPRLRQSFFDQHSSSIAAICESYADKLPTVRAGTANPLDAVTSTHKVAETVPGSDCCTTFFGAGGSADLGCVHPVKAPLDAIFPTCVSIDNAGKTSSLAIAAPAISMLRQRVTAGDWPAATEERVREKP